MRTAAIALILAMCGTTSALADARKDACPEGPTTLTGVIGMNRIFPPPEYWVDQSEPCRIHVIELEAANAACEKGAKFTVTGKVEYVKVVGELSLVHIVKPDKLECTK